MSNTDERRTLVQKLRPLLLFQRYSGFLFYELLDDGEIDFTKKAQIHLTVVSFIHIALAVQICQLYAKSSEIYFDIPSVLEKLVCLLYAVLDVAYYLTEMVLSKLYNKRMLRILNEFGEKECELRRIGIDVKFTLQSSWWCLLFVYGGIIITHLTTLFYVDYTAVGNIVSSSYRTFLFSSMCVTQMAFIVSFFNIVFIARDTVKTVNSSFEKKFCKVGRTNVSVNVDFEAMTYIKRINKISEILQAIFDLLRQFNKAISIRILLLFALFFNWITVHVFNFVMVVVTSGFAPEYDLIMFFSMGSMVYSLLNFGICILAAELFYKEIAALKRILFKIVNNFDNKQITREIGSLTLEIWHGNYEITAAGFFVIDVKLLPTIIAAITMYTVVLTQFNPDAGVFHEYMRDHLL